jgi:hypothetical protein
VEFEAEKFDGVLIEDVVDLRRTLVLDEEFLNEDVRASRRGLRRTPSR